LILRGGELSLAIGVSLLVIVPLLLTALYLLVKVVRHLLEVGVAGCKHLWVGEKYASQALNTIASVALDEQVTLPTTWDGGEAEILPDGGTPHPKETP
jgi:hypothetical protein